MAFQTFSVLDGWWVEGYNGANGWRIGDETELGNENAQDDFDANGLYQTLEDEIVPLYYNRDRDNVPRGWVSIMRETIMYNSPAFSMHRMVKQYTTDMYVNSLRQS